jgi:cyclase
MVKKRLIASLLVKSGLIVQSINFKHPNVIGNAITAVDFFNTWSIDEIVILDISDTDEERHEFLKIIGRLSKRCFVPLTVGGWLRSAKDIKQVLEVGADKVTVNSEAVRRPEFISEASKNFGSQCIVASIDVKRNKDGGYEVYSERGKTPNALGPTEWARKAEELGCGEIYLTSIDKDGSRKGYDLDLVQSVVNTVSVPVIAFGGAWKWQDFVDGVKIGGADAVAAANIFHFTEHSTKRAKEFMKKSGINVREPVFYRITSPRKPIYDSKI